MKSHKIFKNKYVPDLGNHFTNNRKCLESISENKMLEMIIF